MFLTNNTQTIEERLTFIPKLCTDLVEANGHRPITYIYG